MCVLLNRQYVYPAMTTDASAPKPPFWTVTRLLREQWTQLDRGWKATILGNACTAFLLLHSVT